jgi:chromosome segregation ATPase
MAHQLQAEREALQKQYYAELNNLQNTASTHEQQLAAYHQQADTKAAHVHADLQKIAEVKAQLEAKKAEVEARDQEVQRRRYQVENAEDERFALKESKLPKRIRT